MKNFFTQHPKCCCFKPAAHIVSQLFSTVSQVLWGSIQHFLSMSTYSFAFMTLFTTPFFELKSHHLIYEHLLFEWTKKSCWIIHNLLELALFYLPVLIFPHSSACQRANVWVTGGQLAWYTNTALLSKGISCSISWASPAHSRALGLEFVYGPLCCSQLNLSSQKRTVKTSPPAITSVILWYLSSIKATFQSTQMC